METFKLHYKIKDQSLHEFVETYKLIQNEYTMDFDPEDSSDTEGLEVPESA